ncbi:MAG: hypothetical protein NTU53_08380 [Planctomycetota bacterium]|nr:hypothetical protein [Planctomycetota bacterium]
MLFPGNRNQQHAATCILYELKWAQGIVPNFSDLESRYGISRRTLQRTRAKLARLEHVSSMNARYGGQQGWRLSGRFSAAMRLLAENVDQWCDDANEERRERERRTLQFLG